MKILFYLLAALCLAIIWKGLPDLAVIVKIVLSVVSLAVLHLLFAKALGESKDD